MKFMSSTLFPYVRHFLHSILVIFFNLSIILYVPPSYSICSKSIELILSSLYFQRLTSIYFESSLDLNLFQKEKSLGFSDASDGDEVEFLSPVPCGPLTISINPRNIISKRLFS